MIALLNPSCRLPSFLVLAAAGLAMLMLAAPVQAQSARELAGRLEQVEQELLRLRQASGAKPGAPGQPPGAIENQSDITVRLMALERTVEQLTGLIEETQFTTARTAKQVQVMQDDLSLRLFRIEQSLGVTPGLPVDPALTPPPVQQQSQLVPSPAVPGNVATALPQAENALPPAPASAFAPNAPLSSPVSQQPSTRPIAPPPAQTAAIVPGAGASAEALSNDGGFVVRTDAQGRPLAPDPSAPQFVAPPQPPPPTPQQAAPRAVPAPGPVTTGQVASVPPPINVALPDGTPKQQYEFAF